METKVMKEERREREDPDDVNEIEMNVMVVERPEIEEPDDVNESVHVPLAPRFMLLDREGNDFSSSTNDRHYQHEHHQTKPKHSIIEMKELEELKEILGPPVVYYLHGIHQPVRQCCIHRVPKDLRKINEEAYTPQVISIGPLHHGKKEIFEMEKQKLRYILEFRKREGATEKLKEFKRFIQDNEQHILNYYQESSNFDAVLNIILIDAVFIIEFFLKNAEQKREFDFFLDTTCVKAAITRDLQLLENQLPYFVLEKLFEKGSFHNFTKENYPDIDPFLILSHRFFFDTKNDVIPKPKDQIKPYKIQHFTDLRRYFLLMADFCPREKQPAHIRDLPIATKLHGSGVKFKKGIEGRSSLEISGEYVKRAIRIPYFKALSELQIPFIKEL
ncbi:hypothetical protein LWI29_031710 [Acer saccharum]|uniref:Uncharacterized protein n=1 Tax=Acer saccharum TaxID=4024 RepID=A0AA39VE03_ACESA|nr:hypothetical protein LWI29_031710 [Acer saccharum]